MYPTSHDFLKLGNIYTKSTLTKSDTIALRRFKSFFGISPAVCSIVWEKLTNELPQGSQPKHLLWSLSFLKQYSSEHYRRAIFQADEKTNRKWTWVFVELMSNLNVIIWEKRLEGAAPGQTCFVSLDGVDFKIAEPKPFSSGWCSHKIRAAGLRYEVGLNIRTDDMVWVNGGYPCGLYPDLKLARESYVFAVGVGERTLADKGYKDNTFFILKNAENCILHDKLMSRHETVNKRLKQFKILKEEFRHSLDKHPMVFHAVANVTQLMLENGEPLFSVNAS